MHRLEIQSTGTIVAMGDSLTEGLGVPEEKAYPALLQKALRDKGYDYRVVNAGISGETSSGARSRIGVGVAHETGYHYSGDRCE